MEERTILCKSVRRGHVKFADLRDVLSDLIELWSSIRPFVRCTGNPEAKDKAERVSENLFPLVFNVIASSFVVSMLRFIVTCRVHFSCRGLIGY